MKRIVQGAQKKCLFSCIYCFTQDNYKTNGQRTILDEELKDVELIQPFCDYDVFACENGNWHEEIASYLKYGKIVSFSTKAYISPAIASELSSMNSKLKDFGAFLHVGITFTTIKLINEIEPKTTSYEKRLESLRNLYAAGIPVSVILRPLLPVLSIEELIQLVDDTKPFCNNYIYGPLYLNKRIEDYLREKGIDVKSKWHKVNWMDGQPKRRILINSQIQELEYTLKRYCRQVGKDVVASNDDAVERIRR